MPAIYWQQVPVVQEVWDTFVKRALELVKRTRTGKIDLVLENPTFRKNVFAFSGKISPSQQFYVSKDIELDQRKGGDIGWNYCETNNKPYTTDILICLILMYDLGMLKWFSAGDDNHETYQGALEDVKKKYALKNSYAKLVRIGNGDDVNAISMPKQKAMKPRTKKAKVNGNGTKKAKGTKGTKGAKGAKKA